MKKKTRRSESQYPALDPKLNLKSRSDLLDMDYIDQLSDKDKQWMNDFLTESVLADFKTNQEEGRKRIHKKKRVAHEKNKDLRKIEKDLKASVKIYVGMIKEFQSIIDEKTQAHFQNMKSQVKNSPIHVKSKMKIKDVIIAYNVRLKSDLKKYFSQIKDTQAIQLQKLNKLVTSEFKYITDYYKKDAERNNNARNSCILTRSKSQGASVSIDLVPEGAFGNHSTEDSMIAMIDAKREIKD